MKVADRLLAAHIRKATWHGVVLEGQTPGGAGVVVESVEKDSPAATAGLLV